ncbi:RagB/SusD family nutrient uptake outer membrane protein [Niabella ginsengisoli]|uniref:RagB/SusD family nutrient uptake outer membrane protein n=1 Tax=Niabella ginsengisoli TaxID=522298 RepID=A0ABS9SMZ9_9BACT|nr:RagB/SusD family nutrient uptake outer membrane protein [Niabella ginsengisoli]MCH5599727.1 RagB/SusD family nutrient uptake outer membrane protein [Niabella ginsengisoli]
MKKAYIILPVILTLLILSCGKGFLDTDPQGVIIDEQLKTTKAVEASLIGAYGILNGNINGTWGNYSSGPSQWLYGEVAADNAHKGSNSGDQSPMNDIELHRVGPTNDNLPTMWRVYYEGIIRCNKTLQLLKTVQESDANDRFSDERATQIEAEAKLLRGHYYFFLKRVFVNIPYLDETITSTADAVKVPNTIDVDPMIEADFKFAVDNLEYTKPLGEVGRVDKYAAEAYLGKLYLYQKKYPEALVLFKNVITNKAPLTDMPFQNNFDINTENGPEGILVAQNIINDDGSGDNGNVGDMLAGLYNSAPISCCGFYQPSVDLANAYKVNASGLPLLDNSYRTNPYKSDLGLSGAAKTNYQVNKTLAFDPRLDYTIGRRGVSYRDWGTMPGDDWIRDPAYGGPFVAVKQMIDKSDFSGNTSPGTTNITGLNVNIIRLADVYLMAAECAVETNDLTYARNRVNDVRNRASSLPAVTAGGTPAAAYDVNPYASFPNQEYARNAVRFERRLELAMEGHRFYDLVRWGIAKTVIEDYQDFEKDFVSSSQTITFEDKDTYYPIPQEQMDRSGGALTQNDGY